MTEETNLREAAAEVEVRGILSEKNLKADTMNGKEVIKGTLVVQTDKTNFVTFHVFCTRLKKDGTENKVYAGIQTVMKEYRSIAEAGREQATRVHINSRSGRIEAESYYDDSLQIQETLKYKTQFINRVPNSDFKPLAAFSVEMFIKSLQPETIKTGEEAGEETGRLLVNGYVPARNGIFPIRLIAPKEIAEDVENILEAGQTALFEGEIVNRKIVETIEAPIAIGKARKQERITYRSELLITGCTEPYGEERAYTTEQIQKALAVREETLLEKRAKKEAALASRNGQMGIGSKPLVSSGRTLPF